MQVEPIEAGRLDLEHSSKKLIYSLFCFKLWNNDSLSSVGTE